MKYLLTSLKQRNNTQLLIENVVPARTSHIRGYGVGVTFTSSCNAWKHSTTFASLRLSAFSEPTVITQ
jgi:hypothetical protein